MYEITYKSCYNVTSNNVTYFIYTILILAVLKIQTLIFMLQPLFMAGIWFVI